MFGRFGPRYGRSDAVTFKEHVILKKVDSRTAEIEVRATQAAYELGRTSGLFRVPQVVEYDKITGLIELERIKGYISLGQLLDKAIDTTATIYKVGAALACVHQHLKMPSEICLYIDDEWLTGSRDIVPMHGDFNTINVGCDEEDGEIVILDWASSPILSSISTIGPLYWDLATFLYSLLVHQANFMEAVRFFPCRRRAFLEGYVNNSQTTVDARVLKSMLLRISGQNVRSIVSQRREVKWVPYAVLHGLSHIIFHIS